ncbi:MGDG synthase family glycosyltransferase [Oceanobacillus bengalensis]|nr:hypothetical protein [Oceanobacillus bengalensis]
MCNVLLMPLLQIPSGHHHVADCIKDQLLQSSEDFQCEKVEILSYCYGKLETLISTVYLQGIHKLPNVYSWIYKTLAVKGKTRNRHYLYEHLFLKKVSHIINQIRPDVIICTHALPSYLVNRLKEINQWEGIVINAYTDYFINDLWGIKHIDYHLVPSTQVKQELLIRGVCFAT